MVGRLVHRYNIKKMHRVRFAHKSDIGGSGEGAVERGFRREYACDISRGIAGTIATQGSKKRKRRRRKSIRATISRLNANAQTQGSGRGRGGPISSNNSNSGSSSCCGGGNNTKKRESGRCGVEVWTEFCRWGEI